MMLISTPEIAKHFDGDAAIIGGGGANEKSRQLAEEMGLEDTAHTGAYGNTTHDQGTHAHGTHAAGTHPVTGEKAPQIDHKEVAA